MRFIQNAGFCDNIHQLYEQRKTFDYLINVVMKIFDSINLKCVNDHRKRLAVDSYVSVGVESSSIIKFKRFDQDIVNDRELCSYQILCCGYIRESSTLLIEGIIPRCIE